MNRMRAGQFGLRHLFYMVALFAGLTRLVIDASHEQLVLAAALTVIVIPLSALVAVSGRP